MDRHVVCLRVPSFELALVRLTDPSLSTKPVVIASSGRRRGLIREASVEARDAGAVPGMGVEFAARLCPGVTVVASNPARLRRGHEAVQSVVAGVAPVWEPFGPGRFYLDVTGTERLFGAAAQAGRRVARELRARERLSSALGVAANKLVSHVAAESVPAAALRDVAGGEERRFLAPFAPPALPQIRAPGWAPVLAALRDLNLPTLGSIAGAPLAALELALGTKARSLHQWAQGIDPAPVRPPSLKPGLAVTRAVGENEEDGPRLRAILYAAVESLCSGLRRQGRCCGMLRLTVLQVDQVEQSAAAAIVPPSPWEPDLFPRADRLLKRCMARRVRARALILDASALSPSVEQVSLFERPDGAAGNRQRSVAATVHRIRARFGRRAIAWGRTAEAGG